MLVCRARHARWHVARGRPVPDADRSSVARGEATRRARTAGREPVSRRVLRVAALLVDVAACVLPLRPAVAAVCIDTADALRAAVRRAV